MSAPKRARTQRSHGWEWMVERAAVEGWATVGKEIQELGGNNALVGRRIRQHAASSPSVIASALAWIADPGLAAELKSTLNNVVPYATLETPLEALELQLASRNEHVVAATVIDSDLVALGGGGGDGGIRIVSLETGKTVTRLVKEEAVPFRVSILDAHDGLLVAGAQALTQIWDLGSHRCLITLPPKRDWVSSAAVIDKSNVVTASYAGEVEFWRMDDKGVWTVNEKVVGQTAAAWVARVSGGRVAISWSVKKGGTAAFGVWDVALGEREDDGTFLGGGSMPVELTDGRIGTRAAQDGTIRCYGGVGGIVLKDFDGLTFHAPICVLDNGLLLTTSNTGPGFRLWDDQGNAMGAFSGTGSMTSLLISLPNSRVISVGEAGVYVWNPCVALGSGLDENGGADKDVGVTCAGFLEDGRVILGNRQGKVQVWSAIGERGYQPIMEAEFDSNHALGPNAVMAYCGGFVSVGGMERSERLWSEAREGAWENTKTLIRNRQTDFVNLLVALDERRIVTASDGNLRLIESDRWKHRRFIRGYVRALVPVSASRVVIGTAGGDVQLVDMDTCEVLTLASASGTILGLLLVRDGTHVLASSASGKVLCIPVPHVFVEPENLGPCSVLYNDIGHTFALKALAGDGSLVITQHENKLVELWSWNDEEFKRLQVLVEPVDSVAEVLFDATRNLLCVFGRGGSFNVYELQI